MSLVRILFLHLKVGDGKLFLLDQKGLYRALLWDSAFERVDAIAFPEHCLPESTAAARCQSALGQRLRYRFHWKPPSLFCSFITLSPCVSIFLFIFVGMWGIPQNKDGWVLLNQQTSHPSLNFASCRVPVLSLAAALAYARALPLYHPYLLVSSSHSSSLCLLFNLYGPLPPSLTVSRVFRSFHIIYQSSVPQTVFRAKHWICILICKQNELRPFLNHYDFWETWCHYQTLLLVITWKLFYFWNIKLQILTCLQPCIVPAQIPLFWLCWSFSHMEPHGVPHPCPCSSLLTNIIKTIPLPWIIPQFWPLPPHYH